MMRGIEKAKNDEETFDDNDLAELLNEEETKNYKIDKFKYERDPSPPQEDDDKYRKHMSWMPNDQVETSPLTFIPPSG